VSLAPSLEAAYLRTQLFAQTADPEKPETLAPLQKAVTEFLDNYSDSKRAQEIAGMQMSLVRFAKAPEADAILKKLAKALGVPVTELLG
jgi:hypothetical protein